MEEKMREAQGCPLGYTCGSNFNCFKTVLQIDTESLEQAREGLLQVVEETPSGRPAIRVCSGVVTYGLQATPEAALAARVCPELGSDPAGTLSRAGLVASEIAAETVVLNEEASELL
jgi:hypothetical protein